MTLIQTTPLLHVFSILRHVPSREPVLPTSGKTLCCCMIPCISVQTVFLPASTGSRRCCTFLHSYGCLTGGHDAVGKVQYDNVTACFGFPAGMYVFARKCENAPWLHVLGHLARVDWWARCYIHNAECWCYCMFSSVSPRSTFSPSNLKSVCRCRFSALSRYSESVVACSPKVSELYSACDFQ